MFANLSFSSVAFYHYGIENGLPEARIVSISQDSTGFIWLAGENNIFRFDGNQFTIYQNTSLNSKFVPFVRINKLFTDSRGILWVGSNDGLSCYDAQKNQFKKLGEGWNQQRVLDFAEDRNGILWIASELGLAKFEPETERTIWFTDSTSSKTGAIKKLPSGYIKNVTFQPDGKIWLSTYPAGLYFFDPETYETEDFGVIDQTEFNRFNISEILFANGKLFIGTLSNGFFWLDVNSKKVQNETIKQIAYAIIHFRQVNDSIFWLATNNGLFHYNLFTGEYNRYTNEPNNPLSLNRTVVNYIFLDKRKNLWLSLGIRGVSYGLTNVPFSHLTIGENGAYQLTHKEVTAIHFDSEGNMLLGYESGQIEKHTFDPLNKTQYTINSGENTRAGSVMAILEDKKGRIWAGGWMTGLNVYQPGNSEFEPAIIKPDKIAELLKNADIRGITEDNYGNIWVGFHGIGIGKYNPESKAIKLFRQNNENPLSGLSNDFVYNLCFDRNDNLWVASAHGVSKLNPETELFTSYYFEEGYLSTLNSNTVTTVHCDVAGIVWAGTDKGLNMYLPDSDKFIPVDFEHDHTYLHVTAIESVKPGEIWLSTQSGIFRIIYKLNAEDNDFEVSSTYFNRSDGLLSSSYFARTSATSSDGIVFFAGNEGIDLFNPEDVPNYNDIPVKVLITELMVDGANIFPETGSVQPHINKLVLDHDHRMFSIRFTSIDFSNPGIKKFRYRLEGLNDHWVYLVNEHAATFTHLQPGNYTFMLETQNKNGQWVGENAVLQINIKRPFWMSIPFYVFAILFVTGIIYLFFRARSGILMKRQKELERIIDERTKELIEKNKELEIANQTKNKFFSIISHDLRSPFSGILGLLELLTEPGNDIDQEKKEDMLNTAKSSAYDTFELLENLLLWARTQMEKTNCVIKKQNLSELLKKNLGLKRQIALQKEVSISGKFPEHLVASFDKEMINTVIRNILSNAIKFTHPGGDVVLSARTFNGEVIVSVADTGIGLSEEGSLKLFEIEKTSRAGVRGEKGTGLGLVICREFVEKNNGKIWAEPNHPEGTIFHFTLPVNQ